MLYIWIGITALLEWLGSIRTSLCLTFLDRLLRIQDIAYIIISIEHRERPNPSSQPIDVAIFSFRYVITYKIIGIYT